MNTDRGGYVVALVAAVVTLLASVGLAFAAADQGQHRSGGRPSARADGWMMDRDGGRTRGPMGSMMRDRQGAQGGSGWAGSQSYGWTGTGPVTAAQARVEVQRWVDRYAADAQLGDGSSMPMGYLFQVSQDGTLVAMVMVDEDTGSVWGHLRDTARQR